MQQTASQRKGLLAQARGTKEPKRPTKYRRGSVSNSGASLQPPRPDVNAGKDATENAKFINDFKEFVYGKGMLHEQYRESERDKGVAQFEKANTEQRESFRDAIANDWIDSKESPYFRQKVTEMHTKELLNKTSFNLYTEYEKWEGKNDPSSGSFEAWMQTQDDKIALNLENIPNSILADHFYEPHQGIKRQLSQHHAKYLNKEFRDKANDGADLEFNRLMKAYAPGMGLDQEKYDGMTWREILKKHGSNEDQARRVSNVLKMNKDGILEKGALRELEEMSLNEGGIAEMTLFNYNGTERDDLRAFSDSGDAWELTPEGREINKKLKSVTSDATISSLGASAGPNAQYPTAEMEKTAETFNDTISVERKLAPVASNIKENPPFSNSVEIAALKYLSNAEDTQKSTIQPTDATILNLGSSDLKDAKGNLLLKSANSRIYTDVYIEAFSKSGAHSEFFKGFSKRDDKYTLMQGFMSSKDKYKNIFQEGTKGRDGHYRVGGPWATAKLNAEEFKSYIESKDQ